MKRQFIKELAEGSRVDAVFVLSAREMRSTRQGDAFLSAELSDKTGRMPAVLFRPDAIASGVCTGMAVRIAGTVTTYRGLKRISVSTMEPARSFDPEDMLATSKRDREEQVAELRALAAGVRDRRLRAVLKAVFGQEEFFARFIACPGAQSHHHAYIGGLLEHTVSVAKSCRMLAGMYDGVDADLLVCAALLHDIGKVDELEYGATIEYTDEGRLVGHVVLGDRRVRDAIRSAPRGMPDGALKARLSHALLAHHGELEWGSPKRPSTIEALLLHHADNLDAKAAGFAEIMSGASALEERWTDAQNLFRRPLFAPVSHEDERPGPAFEDDLYQSAGVRVGRELAPI